MKIIPNFIEPEAFKKIKSLLESTSFPWYYSDKITDIEDPVGQGYFTHTFFNLRANSSFFSSVESIVDKLNVKALIRIKANLYHRTEKLIIHKPHTDYDYKHKGAIFSINTCNGYTILQDGTKIKSKENTLLLFDSYKSHQSTNCTDQKIRLNINFNFF